MTVELQLSHSKSLNIAKHRRRINFRPHYYTDEQALKIDCLEEDLNSAYCSVHQSLSRNVGQQLNVQQMIHSLRHEWTFGSE